MMIPLFNSQLHQRSLTTSSPHYTMPVFPRRQARHAEQAHAISHTNLNNLPAEIIEGIAYQLDPDADTTASDGSEFSDIDYDRMSVISVDPKDGPPEIKAVPCCQLGDKEADADEPRIPVLNQRSIFSSASKRIRNIVFDRKQSKRRTIRYCDRWIQETMQIPEATRARYT
jgi:hypothetical protein